MPPAPDIRRQVGKRKLNGESADRFAAGCRWWPYRFALIVAAMLYLPWAGAAAQGWAPSVEARDQAPVATGIELATAGGMTRLSLRLSRTAHYQVFRLRGPDRVVVDLDAVEFRMPPALGRQATGLIAGLRFGAFAPGRSRIVVATNGPVKVEGSRIVDDTAGGVRLEIDLAPATAVELAASEVAAAAESLRQIAVPAEAPAAAQGANPPAQPRRAQPVVVVDPGHGGVDSGALGQSGAEKDVVLAVGRALRSALERKGRYRVHMTRDGDTFVPLERRLRVARELEADLFISLHADSLESRSLAGAIRGASIYTRSGRASNEHARRLAEKENAADLFAGLPGIEPEGRDQVQSILFDLMQRETGELSVAFRQLLRAAMQKELRLAKDAERAADFFVLRQPATPSVLIELGYMSHPEDERLMFSKAWQQKAAAAIAAAVENYFTRIRRPVGR